MPTFPLIIASVFADDFADKATLMENAPKVKFAAVFNDVSLATLYIRNDVQIIIYSTRKNVFSN